MYRSLNDAGSNVFNPSLLGHPGQSRLTEKQLGQFNQAAETHYANETGCQAIQSPADEALGWLDSDIERLCVALQQLNDRLAPVLGPECPAKVCEPGPCPASPLVGRVQAADARVSAMTDYVQTLLSRLTV